MEKDERFKHITTDPKFRRIPKKEKKVKIDKRFQSMFSDEKFKVKYTIDKRGRPVNHTSTEDLKRYYELSSDEDSTSDFQNDDESVGRFVRTPKNQSNDLKVKHESNKNVSDKVKNKLKDLTVDYARGEGKIMSESSSDDNSESEEELSEDEDLDHGWGELDKDAGTTNEITNRLAICNMDWDRIRAVDLMVLFNSFLPSGGIIHSITIYPSEFGLQRMKEEEIKGPIELVTNNKFSDDENEENEEGSKYHMEKLRKYQLNRLKYYYGVIVCDHPETANKLYTECDGREYESSSTKIDLRFIPDDEIFYQEPKELCDKLPDLQKYQPRFFTTTALQQAKVELTWDETNPERLELTKKLAEGKIDDITDTDLQMYLASSNDENSESESENELDSDDDNSNKKDPIDKYRALLQELEENEKLKKNKDVEMEISWGLGGKEKTEKLVKKKIEENKEKTPFQQYLDKRKEKRKTKREEKNNKCKNESNDDENDIPSDVDMNDPYFAEEFNKPEFKKNKQKKINNKEEQENDEETKQNETELELLLLNENEDAKKHFSLKKIQEKETSKKKKKKKLQNTETKIEGQDDFEINIKDERFSALFSSYHYNIDPTDSHYRKTKAMDALIEEKLKRRTENEHSISNNTAKKQKTENEHSELNVLIKSVMRKTKALENKK